MYKLNYMWKLFLIVVLFSISDVVAQEEDYSVLKENLTKKESLFYDYNKINIQSIGAYYVDKLGKTTMKHGEWLYFNRDGKIEEKRNYYKDLLHGKVELFMLILNPNKRDIFT